MIGQRDPNGRVTDRCERCVFFVLDTDIQDGWWGDCHRYPPVFRRDAAEEIGYGYPGIDDWCGEFRKRAEVER